MMNVEQVIGHVQQWVELHAKQIEGFRAAHLMGGILSMDLAAPFPRYRDVDFNIVCGGPRNTTTHDVAHRGLVLEYSLISSERYCSPEMILADPELAANIARGGILADPYGMLAALQSSVAGRYPAHEWMQ